MRIIELLIEDADMVLDGIGIDEVALVKRPAHEEGWLAFSEHVNKKQPYEVLTPEEMLELGEALSLLGESPEELEEEGWEIVKVEKLGKEKFVGDISSDPNAVSAEDTVATRVRYKYVGPKDSKNRDFCAAMVGANRVYRREDIYRMTASVANDEFGYYDIFQWRGSFNCRHEWVKLLYKQVNPEKGIAQNRILNDADRRRNLEGQQIILQEPTETRVTANARERRSGFSTEDFQMVGIMDNAPLFDNKEEAIKVADFIGCKGYHEHKVGKNILYMPCEKHPETFETYEYPNYITETAQRALNYIEESGNPNGCLTPVGRRRVSDLASGKEVSLDILKRMKAYGDRHKKDLEASTSLDDGCGMLAYMSWGLDVEGRAMEWLEKEIERLEMDIDVSGLPTYKNQTGETISQEFITPNPCRAGYIAYGTKIKDGREVPNCVPVENNATQLKFSYDDDKMEITGAAMLPNKMIIRSTPMGEPYYVYFSKETIKKLAFKFMKEKRMDATNIEHTSLKAKDTYVVESWLISDEYNDKANALGLNYPNGSWVITMKTDDPEVWAKIKEGEYTGFSVEGYFEEKVVFTKEDHLMNGIKNILNNITNDK